MVSVVVVDPDVVVVVVVVVGIVTLPTLALYSLAKGLTVAAGWRCAFVARSFRTLKKHERLKATAGFLERAPFNRLGASITDLGGGETTYTPCLPLANGNAKPINQG